MTRISTKQYVGTVLWMLVNRSGFWTVFVFGLALGTLIGFAISAPLFGWHLSADASTVMSAFFGGVAGVSGAVLVWRLQERAQRRSVESLVTTALTALRSAIETTAEGFSEDPHPMHVFAATELKLRSKLLNYQSTWNKLGIHQSVFDVFASMEIIELNNAVEDLLDEITEINEKINRNMPVEASDIQLMTLLIPVIGKYADSVLNRLKDS